MVPPGDSSYVEGVVVPSLIYAVGGEELNIDTDNLVEGSWNSPEMVDVFTRVKTLVDEGVIDTKGLGMDPFQGQLALLNGDYACASADSGSREKWRPNRRQEHWVYPVPCQL